MKGTEHEHSQDDLDVEITDLPTEVIGDNKVTSARGPLPRLFGREVSSRRPALRLAVAISLVVLTLLVILGSSASVRDMVALRLFGPTPIPTASLVPGDDLFYIEGTPSWGSISIDGHVLPHPPAIGLNPPLRLARGQHRITWSAPPFLPQRCVASVPPRLTTDNCHITNINEFRPGPPASVIIFYESLAILPGDQRAALTQQVQALLDTLRSTETVLPGEQYVHAQPNSLIDTATQPLHATLRFLLDANTSSNQPCVLQQASEIESNSGEPCGLQGQNCSLFCTQLEQTSPVPLPFLGDGWNVSGMVRTSWDYTTLDGKVIAADQPDERGGATGIEHSLPLHITWDGSRWHVAISKETNFTCAAAQDDLTVDRSFETFGIETNHALAYSFATEPNHAAGCLIVVDLYPLLLPNATATPSSSPSPPAYLLHRFGLFLAANAAAHRYWPNLPLADIYEQKLAQLLAQNLPTA